METQPKTRVLIVDDDQTLCDMYAERLKAEGFEVAVAHNGEEGAAKATEYLPNVILLDLMMPKVNGFNTLEILKSTEETKNIPVLLLTALIQEENKRRGLQAGAEDYIIKSESMPGDVITKIKAAVEKSKQAQARAADGGQNVPQSSVSAPPSADGYGAAQPAESQPSVQPVSPPPPPPPTPEVPTVPTESPAPTPPVTPPSSNPPPPDVSPSPTTPSTQSEEPPSPPTANQI